MIDEVPFLQTRPRSESPSTAWPGSMRHSSCSSGKDGRKEGMRNSHAFTTYGTCMAFALPHANTCAYVVKAAYPAACQFTCKNLVGMHALTVDLPLKDEQIYLFVNVRLSQFASIVQFNFNAICLTLGVGQNVIIATLW